MVFIHQVIYTHCGYLSSENQSPVLSMVASYLFEWAYSEDLFAHVLSDAKANGNLEDPTGEQFQDKLDAIIAGMGLGECQKPCFKGFIIESGVSVGPCFKISLCSKI